MISDLLLERLNYCIYVILLLVGLWAMLAKRNLIKKLIGMSIFQTAIILFYVSIAVKEEATIPIYLAEHDPHGSHHENLTDKNDSAAGMAHNPMVLAPEAIKQYSNPLPHVLMLTAIVVGVATLGLALALCLRIYQGYGTIEEDVLLDKLDRVDERASLSPIEKSHLNAKRRTSRQRGQAKSASSTVAALSSPKSTKEKTGKAPKPSAKAPAKASRKPAGPKK
jgi:multicomponent Na+:H+ antiporter subunit C